MHVFLLLCSYTVIFPFYCFALDKEMQGEVFNGRYYAPKNIFSCEADDFGEGKYRSQDVLTDQFACIAFYNSIGNFKKAEVMFIPGVDEKKLDKKVALKQAFDSFGIGILEEVDNAQGIEILKEEMVDDNTFFAAISVRKNSFLKSSDGRYLPATRGYLIFHENEKLVVLTNQKVTSSDKHTPEKHMGNLKKSILDFRKTFDFQPTAPLKYQQKVTISSYKSEQDCKEMASEFLKAAEGDANLKIINIRYEQEKWAADLIAYNAIITCHVSQTDKDVLRIQGKMVQNNKNLIPSVLDLR